MTAPSPCQRPRRRGISGQRPRGTAPRIIDAIGCRQFPDATAPARQAARTAPAIAALRDRCRARGAPVLCGVPRIVH